MMMMMIIILSVEPGRDGSPEVKLNFIKYEFPLSSYTQVGTFTSTGLAEGTVPQGIGKVVEMRIRVLGHNSESWIILSEVTTTLCTIALNLLTASQIEIFGHPRTTVTKIMRAVEVLHWEELTAVY